MERPANRRRRRKRIDPWQLFKSILSGLLMTVGIFLILTAIGELLVLLFDIGSSDPGTYQDWWATPLMMVIASIPFFAGYVLLNLSRYGFYHKIVGSIKVPAALRRPEELDEIELD